MDIYRARFVQYPTPGINALAFSHTTNADFPTSSVDAGGRHSLRLAVGRSNGDIEIWNPLDGRWVQEVVFKGGKGRSVEGLLWTQEPPEFGEDGKPIAGALRLFSIGYSNAVTEWNLVTGLPLREWAGNHSEIWCLAAQPRLTAEQSKKKPGAKDTGAYLGQNIVAGCADGSLVVLSTADNDLQFQKFLTRPTAKNTRVLSISYQNRSTIVAGFADSTIRVYDVRKGSLIRNVTLGGGPKGGPKNILVWSVKCLPSGDIVTGDSTGEVRFFDRKQMSQIHRIASHDADILDLVVSAKSGTVFSAGMDRRTSRYQKGTNTSSSWVKTDHTTLHEHDIKALASHESDKIDVVASGGIDTNLVISPLRRNQDEYQYTISGLPQTSPMTSCTQGRLVACWWEREVSIWKISTIAGEVADKKHELKARIAVQGEENISSVSLNVQGSRIAIATSAGIKLFSLTLSQGPYEVQRLCTIGTGGARIIKFSPNSKWLAVVTAANEVIVYRKGQKKRYATQQHLKRRTLSPVIDPSLGEYLDTFTRIEFSPDSKMLVASDLRGYLDSWIVKDALADTKSQDPQKTTSDAEESSDDSDSDEETSADGWTINPADRTKVESAPLVISFRRSEAAEDKYKLLVLSAKHRLREVDMETGYFTEWSKRNPYSVMPEAFKKVKDRAVGTYWGINGWLWIYGVTWIFGIDTTVDHKVETDEAIHSSDEGPPSKKRKYRNTGAGDSRKKKERGGLILDPDDEEIDVAEDASSEEDEFDDEYGFTDGVNGGRQLTEDGTKSSATWYLTHKYRPIVGIVPVSQARGSKFPEVMLVERPLWDLDLPSRYESEYP